MKHTYRTPTQNSRRAFTFVIIPLILAISMVVLGVIYAVQNQQPYVPNSPRQPALKVVSGVTLFAGWLVVMASPWAEKKGHKSASIFFGAILLLGNLAMLNAVTGWSAMMRAKNQGISATPTAPPPYAAPSQPIASTPAPFVAPDPPPSQLDQSVTPGRAATPAPKPTADAPHQKERPQIRPLHDKTIDFDPIIKHLKEALNTELAARAIDAAAVYKILEKPRHDRKQLDEQIANLSDLRKKLTDSGTHIRSIDNEFADLAEKAGAGRAFAMPKAFDFANEVKSFERGVACERIGHACETGTDLLILLRDNISKWTYDSKGAITTKDKTFEHKLFGPKAQVGFALDAKEDLLAKLKPQ